MSLKRLLDYILSNLPSWTHYHFITRKSILKVDDSCLMIDPKPEHIPTNKKKKKKKNRSKICTSIQQNIYEETNPFDKSDEPPWTIVTYKRQTSVC